MRSVRVGNTSTLVYFNVALVDGTPALMEVGNQPQLSINGNSFSSNGIGPLSALEYGRYTATLNLNEISILPGDVLLTRYKSDITAESEGDNFLVTTDENTIPIQNLNVDHYGTVTGGDLYFNNRLNSKQWRQASPDDKRKSLIMATQLIDRLNFIGSRSYTLQRLQFPRTEILENIGVQLSVSAERVPDDIITACYLIGLKLLSGYSPDSETNSLAISMSKFHVAQTFYERSFVLEHQRAGIPSQEAWLMLRPYVDPNNTITLIKV